MNQLDDKTLAGRLVACTFMPGTWDKKFAHNVWGKINQGQELTDCMRHWLYRLCWKYRKQMRLSDADAERIKAESDKFGCAEKPPKAKRPMINQRNIAGHHAYDDPNENDDGDDDLFQMGLWT